MTRRFFRVALLAILAFLLVSLTLIRHPASESWQSWRNLQSSWAKRPIGVEDDYLRIPQGGNPELSSVDKQAEALGIDVPSFNTEKQDEKPTETRMNLFRPQETGEGQPDRGQKAGGTKTSHSHGHSDDDMIDELNRPFSQQSSHAHQVTATTADPSHSPSQSASSTASVFSAHVGFTEDEKEKSIAQGLGLFPLPQHRSTSTATRASAATDGAIAAAESLSQSPNASRTQTTLATVTTGAASASSSLAADDTSDTASHSSVAVESSSYSGPSSEASRNSTAAESSSRYIT